MYEYIAQKVIFRLNSWIGISAVQPSKPRNLAYRALGICDASLYLRKRSNTAVTVVCSEFVVFKAVCNFTPFLHPARKLQPVSRKSAAWQSEMSMANCVEFFPQFSILRQGMFVLRSRPRSKRMQSKIAPRLIWMSRSPAKICLRKHPTHSLEKKLFEEHPPMFSQQILERRCLYAALDRRMLQALELLASTMLDEFWRMHPWTIMNNSLKNI